MVAWLDDEGVLTRARVRDGASMERESIPLEPDVAVAVALGASGEVYAAVRRANGSFSLVRVPAQGGKF